MTHIVGPDLIKYACTCGLLKPISHLYFCRYCSSLRCGFCVCHEVDSHLCGKCSENLPSSEARLKKNRCGNCHICPSCRQELAIRIGSRGPSNPDDPKSPPKKLYYLACSYCRWSSRDVGIPDQSAATGDWPKRENVHGLRLQELIDGYRGLVLSEREQKDREKKKKNYVSYTDLTGVTAAALRKRIGLPEPPPSSWKTPALPPPATAKEDVDDHVDEKMFTEELDLLSKDNSDSDVSISYTTPELNSVRKHKEVHEEVTTIDQRLLQPDAQPSSVSLLFPIHKQLSIKRSMRCRSCEHNVSKPEYNPSSVKFKIQLFAYYHIPEIRIVTVEPLRAGQSAELILKLTNPTQHQTTIAILPLVPNAADGEQDQAGDAPAKKNVAPYAEEQQFFNSLLSLSSRTPSITIKPRDVRFEDIPNCEVSIPASKVILPPRDDAAEYDDCGDNTHNIQDDPKLVVWRKSNKAFIKLSVTPDAGLQLNEEVTIGFTMQHIYTHTFMNTIDNKEPEKVDHNVKVFLTLGQIVGST